MDFGFQKLSKSDPQKRKQATEEDNKQKTKTSQMFKKPKLFYTFWMFTGVTHQREIDQKSIKIYAKWSSKKYQMLMSMFEPCGSIFCGFLKGFGFPNPSEIVLKTIKKTIKKSMHF